MDTEKTSREDKLMETQLEMIATTGKISGEVKEILTSKDRNKILEKIENIHGNLKKLIHEIQDMSEVLNLNFDEILGGKDEGKSNI